MNSTSSVNHRSLELSYHPVASEERNRLLGIYEWMHNIWPVATRELARQIAGPHDAQPQEHAYFGREGENLTFAPESKDVTAFHFVVWLVPNALGFLSRLASNTRLRQLIARIQAIIGRLNPTQELWIVYSAYYSKSRDKEVQVEVHIEAIRSSLGVSIRILSIEETPPTDWRLQNVFRKR